MEGGKDEYPNNIDLEEFAQWTSHGLTDFINLNVGHSSNCKTTDERIGIFGILFVVVIV